MPSFNNSSPLTRQRMLAFFCGVADSSTTMEALQSCNMSRASSLIALCPSSKMIGGSCRRMRFASEVLVRYSPLSSSSASISRFGHRCFSALCASGSSSAGKCITMFPPLSANTFRISFFDVLIEALMRIRTFSEEESCVGVNRLISCFSHTSTRRLTACSSEKR